MIFKGADNTHLTIYARAPVVDAQAGASNPATNTRGTTTVLFTGILRIKPRPRRTTGQLTVPDTDAANPALDDFSATVPRGSVFRAKCPAGTSPLKMQGIWDYTAAGDANDSFVVNAAVPVAGPDS